MKVPGMKEDLHEFYSCLVEADQSVVAQQALIQLNNKDFSKFTRAYF